MLTNNDNNKCLALQSQVTYQTIYVIWYEKTAAHKWRQNIIGCNCAEEHKNLTKLTNLV